MDQTLILNEGFPILSALIFLPLAGALVMLFIKNDSFCRFWALGVTSIVALLSISLLCKFDGSITKFQFAEQKSWIESLNIQY